MMVSRTSAAMACRARSSVAFKSLAVGRATRPFYLEAAAVMGPARLPCGRSFSTQPLVPPVFSPPEFDHRKNSPAPSSSSFYPHLSTPELVRAALSFTICQQPWLVRNAHGLLNLSHALLGKRVTEMLLEATLYGHFCAGQDERRILPTLERLKEFGIGTMLDFAAEQESTPGPWNAADEAVCDQHTQDFIQSIRAAAVLGPSYASVATHATSLANPKSIEMMTNFLDDWEQVFAKHLRQQPSMTLLETKQMVAELYQDSELKQELILQRLEALVDSQTGTVDLIAWMSLIQEPEDLLTFQSGCNVSVSPEHVAALKAFYDRARRLAHEAVFTQCRLFFDAEQVRYQRAIDHLVSALQQEVNTLGKKPVISGTIQSYRKDATCRLKAEFQRSQRFGYAYGVKLVRGAYMESERALAEKRGVPSPIHETIRDTHDCYNANVDYLLQQAAGTAAESIEICLATHNQDSIQRALTGMDKYGVNKDSVTFGQLYGMHDHLTFTLAEQGNRAFKYVPYGEQDVLVPYLIRRAQENSSVASGAREELRRIFKELRQRVVGF